MVCVKILNVIVRSKSLFQLEGAGLKTTMEKKFKGSQIAWNEFLKPAVNIAAQFFGMAVGVKTKKSKGCSGNY